MFFTNYFSLQDEIDWDRIEEILQIPKNILKKKWRNMCKSNLQDHPWKESEDDIIANKMCS